MRGHVGPENRAWERPAKIIGLLAYICFGMLALRATSTGRRWAGFIGAVGSVAYIFAVALTKQIVPG